MIILGGESVKIFIRLSVVAVLMGIIGSLFVCLRFEADEQLVAAENTIADMGGFYDFFLTHILFITILFFCGLFTFGWITVLPILFFRSYALFFGLFSVLLLNGKEATVFILSLLVSYIFELGAMCVFSPIAAQLSLSLSSETRNGFGKRFLNYFLSFVACCFVIAVSAFIDVISVNFI